MTTASRAFPALVALAAVTACAAVVGVAQLGDAPSAWPVAAQIAHSQPLAPHGCPRAPVGASLAEARAVANLFIDHAVLRRRPECAYALVDSDLRRGSTRGQWARGQLPVDPYRSTSSRVARSSTVRVSLPKELGMWVFLDAPDIGRRVFELVLVARGGRWLVDYWGPTLDPTGPLVPELAPGQASSAPPTG